MENPIKINNGYVLNKMEKIRNKIGEMDKYYDKTMYFNGSYNYMNSLMNSYHDPYTRYYGYKILDLMVQIGELKKIENPVLDSYDGFRGEAVNCVIISIVECRIKKIKEKIDVKVKKMIEFSFK